MQVCGIIKFYYLSVDKKMVKIHMSNYGLLTWKLTFFLFLEKNKCCGY